MLPHPQRPSGPLQNRGLQRISAFLKEKKRTRCVRICTILNNASKVLQVIVVERKACPVLIVHKVKVFCWDGRFPCLLLRFML